MSGQVVDIDIDIDALNIPQVGEVQIVKFRLGGPIEPAQLREVVLPEVDPRRGVIISGRGPVWLFATLAHKLHICPWVATYDPRIGGGVVVQSHVPSVREGDVIPLPEELVSKLTQF